MAMFELTMHLMPSMAAAELTAPQWKDLPPDERADMARSAELAWRTYSNALSHLHQLTQAAGEEVTVLLEDPSDQTNHQVRDTGRLIPGDVLEARQLAALLDGMSREYRRLAAEAAEETEGWARRAATDPFPDDAPGHRGDGRPLRHVMTHLDVVGGQWEWQCFCGDESNGHEDRAAAEDSFEEHENREAMNAAEALAYERHASGADERYAGDQRGVQ